MLTIYHHVLPFLSGSNVLHLLQCISVISTIRKNTVIAKCYRKKPKLS